VDKSGFGLGILKLLLLAVLFASLSAAMGAVCAHASPASSAPIDKLIAVAAEKGNEIAVFAYAAAVRLFWALAVIQLAWSGIQLATRGEWTMFHIVSLLIRETIFIGFFYWLLTQGNPGHTDNLTLMIA